MLGIRSGDRAPSYSIRSGDRAPSYSIRSGDRAPSYRLVFGGSLEEPAPSGDLPVSENRSLSGATSHEHGEATTMAGIGRYKLTDALQQEHPAKVEPAQPPGSSRWGASDRSGRGKGKGRSGGE